MPTALVTDTAGTIHILVGQPGDSVMQLARAAGLGVRGECNGSLACATCHVIVDSEWVARLPAPTEAEEEMLDTLFDLTPTSRLSCQIRLDDARDGVRMALPA